jgi:hypothetical protein
VEGGEGEKVLREGGGEDKVLRGEWREGRVGGF